MKYSPTKTICFFNSNKAWGGGEKWHLTTCKEFQSKGFKTILITNNDSEITKKAIQEKLNVYRFSVGNLSFLNPFKLLTFALFFKFKKIDTLIINLPSDLKVAGIAAKLAGVKKIIYRRGMPHPLRNTWLNRALFTHVLTHIVVNSKEIGKSLEQGNEAWFPKEKLTLIYNGVNNSLPIDRSRKIYEKNGNELVLGNAGRLTEQKGQKYLIDIGKKLTSAGINFKILIAGEGELHQDLQRKIDGEGLSDKIKLLGHVTDMSSFLNSLDVFIFTSLYEGSANTLIETLQFGVPTIAWDTSSNPEVIENNFSGYLVPVGDIEAVIQKCLSIHAKEGVKELIDNGTKVVEEKFDQMKNLGGLEKIV